MIKSLDCEDANPSIFSKYLYSVLSYMLNMKHRSPLWKYELENKELFAAIDRQIIKNYKELPPKTISICLYIMSEFNYQNKNLLEKLVRSTNFFPKILEYVSPPLSTSPVSGSNGDIP